MSEWEATRKESLGLPALIAEVSGKRMLQPTRMDKQNYSLTIMNAHAAHIL